jgi:hypothetical protein
MNSSIWRNSDENRTYSSFGEAQVLQTYSYGTEYAQTIPELQRAFNNLHLVPPKDRKHTISSISQTHNYPEDTQIITRKGPNSQQRPQGHDQHYHSRYSPAQGQMALAYGRMHDQVASSAYGQMPEQVAFAPATSSMHAPQMQGILLTQSDLQQDRLNIISRSTRRYDVWFSINFIKCSLKQE